MDNKKTQEALIQAVVSDYVKETGDKNPDEKKLQNYIKQKGGDKYLQQKLQSLTQKAAHGTKLQYIKNLKNQCADDEELVYFKKGGSLDCGCVKKQESGGEVADSTYNPKTGKFRPATKEEIARRKKNLLKTQKDGEEGSTVQGPASSSPKSAKKACGGKMKKKIKVSCGGKMKQKKACGGVKLLLK